MYIFPHIYVERQWHSVRHRSNIEKAQLSRQKPHDDLCHKIFTMVVSVAVCEIFSVKEWCDLENMVRVRSRSLEMALFDGSHTSFPKPNGMTVFRRGLP